ncbi:MAG: translation initiation factor IF-2 associated domain-containing protein, partial [Methyloversatilis sp.]|nr:translation initiation factor IF-2 associated domain-containing protein [Methyloversatilis sp.]
MSVSQFATELKMPAAALLEQLRHAGVDKQSERDSLTEQDKSRLLDYLRRQHGDTAGKTKITLTRRETTEIKATNSSGQARTVQVEVRKKRVLVKRDPAELLAEEAAQKATETPVVAEAPVVAEVAVVAEAVVVMPEPVAVVEIAPVAEEPPEPEAAAPEAVLPEVLVDIEPESAAEPIVEGAVEAPTVRLRSTREIEADRHSRLLEHQAKELKDKVDRAESLRKRIADDLIKKQTDLDAKTKADEEAKAAPVTTKVSTPGTLHKPA